MTTFTEQEKAILLPLLKLMEKAAIIEARKKEAK